MKNKILIFSLLILLVGTFFVSSQVDLNKIDKKIYDNLDKNKEIRVIVKFKEPLQKKAYGIQKTNSEINLEKKVIREDIIRKIGEKKVKHFFDNSIAIGVSKEELDELASQPNIETFLIDKVFKITLEDSIPLINASSVWPTQISGINITGIDETICVIDTGIDFTHPDLIGRNKICVIDCTNFCLENCLIGDDNGHGTHVAGIAAASGVINGVAVGADLIGVKSLDLFGVGFSTDIMAGINWCTDNSEGFNISVITMSLGEGQYNNYCDSDLLANSINSAVEKGISVTISTGNNNGTQDSTIGIGSPACITNSTRVTATDKNDFFASYAFRNINFPDILAAPGTSINSTERYQKYIVKSGTSMATPHVAGTVALIKQLFRLQYNGAPTPNEIEHLLSSTGKQIYDTQTSMNFSRIDVYSAINCIGCKCSSSADTSKGNIVSKIELTNYITRWKNSEVIINDLMTGIGEWKNGCPVIKSL